MEVANCGYPAIWNRCYSGQYDLWVPDAYSHPAKLSPALGFRIFEHLKELGLLRPGTVVLDPLCGIATVNLIAAISGFASIGVELEERFIEIAKQNAERISLKGFGAPITIIQGDARRLSELLQERGLVALTSPPYSEMMQTPAHGKDADFHLQDRLYGSTPGQVGALPDKPIVVTSPPYGTESGAGGLNTLPPRPGSKDQTGRSPVSPSQIADNAYGSSLGQIGNLPDHPLVSITSPPYGDSEARDRSKEASWGKEAGHPRGDRNISQGIESPGNIASLPDRPLTAITSPPYEDSEIVAGEQTVRSKGISRLYNPNVGPRYGNSQGQIGQERGQTYLEAMLQVFQEVAKVADVLVTITKNPTRRGRLRSLDSDIAHLMERTGFRICCHHKALLFEEQETRPLVEATEMFDIDWASAIPAGEKWEGFPGLGYSRQHTCTEEEWISLEMKQLEKLDQTMTNDKQRSKIVAQAQKSYREMAGLYRLAGVEAGRDYWCRRGPTGKFAEILGRVVKGRLSFFKRLSWQKKSPVAQWEDVIIAVKDLERRRD